MTDWTVVAIESVNFAAHAVILPAVFLVFSSQSVSWTFFFAFWNVSSHSSFFFAFIFSSAIFFSWSKLLYWLLNCSASSSNRTSSISSSTVNDSNWLAVLISSIRRSISFVRFKIVWMASSVWSLSAENLVNALATPSIIESNWLVVGCSFSSTALSPIFSKRTTASSAEIIPLSTSSKILSFWFIVFFPLKFRCFLITSLV